MRSRVPLRLVDGISAVEVDEYLRGRLVCERCRMEQAFARGEVDEETGEVFVAPCVGSPSGLACDSEVAVGAWTIERHAA